MEQAPITTAKGLREAVWDIINDECGDTFTSKWFAGRLPYGARTRRVLKELADAGHIVRVGYGVYRKAGV